jgi:hypothetical protein
MSSPSIPDDEQELRTRCEDTIRSWFPGRRPTDLDAMRTVIARQTGRRIYRVVGDLEDELMPTAMWIKGDRADLLWLHPYNPLFSQRLNEAHEYAHIICGHEPTPVYRSGTAGQAQAERAIAVHRNIHPGLIMGVMNRCGLDTNGADLDPVEREAEMTARLLIAPLLRGAGDMHMYHHTLTARTPCRLWRRPPRWALRT